LLVRGGDLFLEPGIELGKGDFFHGEMGCLTCEN
jgi:hypothetical protein